MTSKQPIKKTLTTQLFEKGISKEYYCKDRFTNDELSSLVSKKVADQFCKSKTTKIKRSGSVGNNKLPQPVKDYWNYETFEEKTMREIPTNFYSFKFLFN